MTKNIRKSPKGIGFWRIGAQYLQLSIVASQELIRQNNPHVIISDQTMELNKYIEITKWSDHAVGIAILFNYFHGIEATLKGFISHYEHAPKNHKLTHLLDKFNNLFPGTPVTPLVWRHTKGLDADSPLGRFFSANIISVDDWYQALKYPESINGEAFIHTELMYGGLKSLPFWEEISDNASRLCDEAHLLAEKLESGLSTNKD